MESFRVELDSPSGVHFPGQLISGRVVIHLKDQIKARAVLIHVLGKAKTSWTVWERRNRLVSIKKIFFNFFVYALEIFQLT